MNCQQSPDLIAPAELMATLAHELNNPLSVIAGQALMLQEMVSDERIAARAAKISQAALRSSRIIKSTLALARQDAIELERGDGRGAAFAIRVPAEPVPGRNSTPAALTVSDRP